MSTYDLRALLDENEALAAKIARVEALAAAWEARGEHDMAYSKTVPEDIAPTILGVGAEMVENARKVRAALDGSET